MNKLNATAFGFAVGIIWAIGVFFLVLLATYAGYATSIVALISDGYWGVEASLIGAIIAIPWAFIDGFIGAYLIAWLYNKLA